MQIPEPLHGFVQNILDESIPEAVKKHLLKLLLSMKYRPSALPRKRKAILGKFDPIPPQKTQTVDSYQKDILELFKHEEQKGDLTFKKTAWAIGHFL